MARKLDDVMAALPKARRKRIEARTMELATLKDGLKMTMFDEIYERTLLEKYGNDGKYIAMHQMDSDFQRLFMLNIVKECLTICREKERANLYGTREVEATIKEHFGVE